MIASLALTMLTACQSPAQSQKTNSESREESSLIKANSRLKKSIHRKKANKKSSTSSHQGVQSETNGSSTKISHASGKSQEENNRVHGYDPNGNPLLPGQDHAAGSNPDGTPDAWVQRQIDEEQFDQENGLIGPDGRFNDKGKAYYNLPDDFYSGN